MSDDDDVDAADMDGTLPPHVIHGGSREIAPKRGADEPPAPELSTADADSESTELGPEPADLASEALRAARAIAAGRAAAQPSRRLRRYRKRRRGDEPGGYSGARPDGRDPVPIGALFERTKKDLGWVAPLSEAALFSRWSDIVGPEIAARCQPTSLTAGELKITAESTAWATQLRLMQREILARIGTHTPAGTVTKLHIAGPSGPSWKHGPWSMKGGRGVRDTYG